MPSTPTLLSAGFIEGHLFDLSADPDEYKNLWNDLKHTSVEAQLLKYILEWRIENGRHAQGIVQMLANRT